MTERWYTVQQPILFPPIYMMERFARCHDVVVLDDAQFDRDNTQFKLMAKDGPRLQSVQLEAENYSLPFNKRKVLMPEVWQRKLLNTVQTVYGKQEHYRKLAPWFHQLVHDMAGETDLHLFCLMSVRALLDVLRAPTVLHMGSALCHERPSEPTAWISSFCSQLQATDYVQGMKSMRSYFVKGPFENQNCRTWGQDFATEYVSTAGRLSDASMSILDHLFTQGVESTRRMLLLDKGPGNQGTVILETR